MGSVAAGACRSLPPGFRQPYANLRRPERRAARRPCPSRVPMTWREGPRGLSSQRRHKCEVLLARASRVGAPRHRACRPCPALVASEPLGRAPLGRAPLARTPRPHPSPAPEGCGRCEGPAGASAVPRPRDGAECPPGTRGGPHSVGAGLQCGPWVRCCPECGAWVRASSAGRGCGAAPSAGRGCGADPGCGAGPGPAPSRPSRKRNTASLKAFARRARWVQTIIAKPPREGTPSHV